MRRITSLLALSLLALSACVTTTSRPYGAWGDTAGWQRRGRVEDVRETIARGNPAGGAVAGAVVGGVLGEAVLGRGGGLFGAVTGAAVGASASEAQPARRWYELYVRYEDGETVRYVYDAPPPFGRGDPVVLTQQGLYRQ